MSGDNPGVINTSALESQVKLAAEVGGPLPPLDETLPLSKIKPNADTWYFSIQCPKCRRTSPIFRDYSNGKLGNPFTVAVLWWRSATSVHTRYGPPLRRSPLFSGDDKGCGNVSDLRQPVRSSILRHPPPAS